MCVTVAVALGEQHWSFVAGQAGTSFDHVSKKCACRNEIDGSVCSSSSRSPRTRMIGPISERRRASRCGAVGVTKVEAAWPLHQTTKSLVSWLSGNFVIWLTVVTVVAVRRPGVFIWIQPRWFTWLLGLVMFSVGATTSTNDLYESAQKPRAVLLNFVACFGFMPLVGYLIARVIDADPATLAGLVLVGSINGGHTSNLCTLIADGDVALSVLMTMSTTAGCIFATPFVMNLLLGTAVTMDAWGICASTVQVVVFPILLGLVLKRCTPWVATVAPLLGIVATCVVVGSSVATCMQAILEGGVRLQVALLALHSLGGLVGFLLARVFGEDSRTCRTVAIETAMKSSAVAYLLATLHFDNFLVRVPAAVSVIWSSIIGGAMAACFRRFSGVLDA